MVAVVIMVVVVVVVVVAAAAVAVVGGYGVAWRLTIPIRGEPNQIGGLVKKKGGGVEQKGCVDNKNRKRHLRKKEGKWGGLFFVPSVVLFYCDSFAILYLFHLFLLFLTLEFLCICIGHR